MKRTDQNTLSPSAFIGVLLELQGDALDAIKKSTAPHDTLRLGILGSNSELSKLSRRIRDVPAKERGKVGVVLNQVKQSIEEALKQRARTIPAGNQSFFDVTAPGKRPTEGHLHIVSQAITEIVRIFERIGFTRVRYPEVDWDWYAF